ncbi:MAG: aminodeoxychorismate synthase component I [Desulfosudaceae bacterium]
MIDQYLKTLPGPRGIRTLAISPEEPFLAFAGRLADEPDTVLLASGGEPDCARYHLLAAWPRLTMTARAGRVVLRAGTGRDNIHQTTWEISPFRALRALLSAFRINGPLPDLPVAAGLFGYFAYDLKDWLEELPNTVVDDLDLPDSYLIVPRLIMVHDRRTGATTACLPEFPDLATDEIPDRLERRRQGPPPLSQNITGGGRFRSNFTRPDYLDAVQTIIDYIAAGDAYQVNLSQRFATDFKGRPFDLFTALFQKNPAPFFAFINAGDHHIISTSPERFLKQRGNRLETRPIKGTRPRGKTGAEDRANREELRQSSKDEAELSMIVDLLRNDLGRVCRGGTVRVTDHKRMEAYHNVFHLVSIVEGELAAGKDAADILAATFPGGSITGCPKIRAMEIIDELEPCRRHIYTGSIGYISFHDTMDLSIAIRTATIRDDRLIYAAGGGIVYDSCPDDEFAETLAKADTILALLEPEISGSSVGPRVWLNGRLQPADQAAVPALSPGFQYGAGLFETIRADQGQPLLLDRHLRRLRASWTELFETPAPDPDWAAIIRQVLHENRLDHQPAAVKILAAHGCRRQPPWDHTLIVTAAPYTHRLDKLDKKGLDLIVYPQPRYIPTASHKTLNYLFYYQAGQWAVRQGADEAIILNPDGTVSETNTANILLFQDETIIVPVSATVLPGVTQQAALEFLEGLAWPVRRQPVTIEDCLRAKAVFLTNSLLGMVAAAGINYSSIPPVAATSDIPARVNRWLGINRT